ncbi:hypothetical protein CDL15_Pgr018457 [Punica granatum]|uniref:Uncharacterized protein n=1 Tax=Punica granatum TaxID=22663 RepID=A0A218WZ95_PUNGR|nr:hypothetical protein CDL15_Pgr018457 [Punica granatum]PKI60597.1 hypothetical protein CRG98_019073 [Punica granatum]
MVGILDGIQISSNIKAEMSSPLFVPNNLKTVVIILHRSLMLHLKVIPWIGNLKTTLIMNCWIHSLLLPKRRSKLWSSVMQEAMRNALKGVHGSRSVPPGHEESQAQSKCIKSLEKLRKAPKKKSDSRQARQSSLAKDVTVPIQLQMTVEELNKIIQDHIAKAKKK